MPLVNAELRSFPGLVPNQAFDVDELKLVKAAATVGAPAPFARPHHRRPFLELVWRVAMARSNLQNVGHSWTRSAAYDRLDPSEKTAVSYFLGMVQAQLACRAMLSISHLTHVDPLLVAAHQPLVGSRPDFVAVNAAQNAFIATVEAKGRTNGFALAALQKAKQQAQRVPAYIPLPVSVPTIASVAYFDQNGAWSVVLEDPPAEPSPSGAITVNNVLVEYYRPVIEAGRQAPGWTERDTEFGFVVPGTSIRLSVPASIVHAFDESTSPQSEASNAEPGPMVTAYKELIGPDSPADTGVADDLIVATAIDPQQPDRDN